MRNKIITTLFISILVLSLLATTGLILNDIKVVELYIFLAIIVVVGCFTLKLYGNEISDLKRSYDDLDSEKDQLDQTCSELHEQVENITEEYESRISKINNTYRTEIDKLNHEKNQLNQTCNNLQKHVESTSKEYEAKISELRDTYRTEIDKLNGQLDNPILITDVFDLYQASLVIRKYNIHKYVIERHSKEVHIYCNMQTYTKMSINKEILPNIKYHIDGTNVIL